MKNRLFAMFFLCAHACITFAATTINPITVTYLSGTTHFSTSYQGNAYFKVAVDTGVIPSNVPLTFSLTGSGSSAGLTANQITSGSSPCNGISTLCGRKFSLQAGERCCLAFNLTSPASGTYTMQPSIATTPPAYPVKATSALKLAVTATSMSYLVDFSPNLWQCPIDVIGRFPSVCTELTNTPSFYTTSDIVLNDFAGVTYSYVSDSTSNVWRCPMSTNGGFSGECTALTNNPAFAHSTDGTAFYTFSEMTYAYITDFSKNVWQCPINDATGLFSGTCTSFNNDSLFHKTQKIAFHTF